MVLVSGVLYHWIWIIIHNSISRDDQNEGMRACSISWQVFSMIRRLSEYSIERGLQILVCVCEPNGLDEEKKKRIKACFMKIENDENTKFIQKIENSLRSMRKCTKTQFRFNIRNVAYKFTHTLTAAPYLMNRMKIHSS